MRTRRTALAGITMLGAASCLVPFATSGAQAATDSLLSVVVATRRLPRGAVLRAGDLAPAQRAVRGMLRSTYTPAAIGWVTRRVIQPGEVLRAPAVAPAPMVAAGQHVHFTFTQDGLALTLDGTAPVAGALGDTIPVRLGARRLLRGVVTGPAQVSAFDPASDSPRTR